MATKEKWVELFEQVIGRKPTADEFLEGKRSDFDPRKIISIAAPAGQSNDGPAEEKQSSVTQEKNLGQEEPALEFLKEESVVEPLKEEKQEFSEPDQYQEQRENWLQAFETNIGKYHFIKQEFTLKGKTEVGEIESKIQLDLATAKNNEIKLDLKSEKKRLKVTMPAEASNATDLKIVVNGKEIGGGLETDIQVVPHQELEVYAKFVVADNTFVTNKESIVVKGDTLDVALSLPKEVTDKIKEKDEEAKKVEANKAKITNFLSEYRTAVFRSVSNRSNYYAQYYDTSSPAYKDMVEWTTGGGVKKAKIDYYDPGALDIREVREENGSYIVTTYEDYTVHYIDSTPNSVNRKNKTYYLKPTGNSFAIYNIEVSES